MPIHWQLEWRKPISMKLVNFAKEVLKTFFNNNKSNENTIDRAIKHEDDYILENIRTTNATEKAIFYADDSMVKVGHSYYPVLFSIPRSCVVHDDTTEIDMPTDITINEWAYKNCYLKSINHILENWGNSIYGLLSCEDYEPMLKYGANKDIIEKIQIKRGLKEYNENIKKRNNDLVHKKSMPMGKKNTKYNIEPSGSIDIEDINNKDLEVETIHKSDDSKDELMIFYTDGSGNLYGSKKSKLSGHYSILLENTNEKWKHMDMAITNNIAEIKGILAAMMISVERGYKNVEIKTDSQGVLKWVNGMDIHIKTNISKVWKARNEDIRYYIEHLVSYGKKIPHLKLTWIKRDLNKAHPI